ncbi:MAG: hypothetical protein FWD78_07770 [Treponema sp.]|nr:hypothetical protein [Treponema sp.]
MLYLIMDYGITLLAKENAAYYNIQWSPLAVADRWTINAKVPAVAGIYEIYWMDEYEKLRMLSVGNTHYGGLRSEIRRLTDSELVTDEKARKILEEKEIWFRYAPTNSASAMADVVWFFRATYFPEDPGVEPSGLYEKIFLKESAPDKLIWVP